MYRSAQKRAPRAQEQSEGGIQTKMLGVNRITKVVKGGRTLRFNSVVVLGDKNGRVAIGTGKAREVSEAIKKAESDGRKNFRTVPIVNGTIPHELVGKYGSSKVKLLPAKEGNGLIAGTSVRAVLELAGYKDVTAKCYGSRNSMNVVKATLDALCSMRTREEIASLRGKKPEEI
ncbi:MAG: 30S ribosomal protein S5 [Christensenellaceae bacterium]|nr:30S ribosomal protein S5 [Christensenellaceae bacterium]